MTSASGPGSLFKDRIQALRIPYMLPGMNELLKLAKEARYNPGARYTRAKARSQSGIVALAKLMLDPYGPEDQVRVSFEWLEPDRRRDPDNIAAGKKIILDALVKAGILSNDGWRNIAPPLIDTWRVSRRTGVIVRLEKVGGVT
jgi:Holliday junction resolvase RusA-like endonuclease